VIKIEAIIDAEKDRRHQIKQADLFKSTDWSPVPLTERGNCRASGDSPFSAATKLGKMVRLFSPGIIA
jgi:hypothetical protein